MWREPRRYRTYQVTRKDPVPETANLWRWEIAWRPGKPGSARGGLDPPFPKAALFACTLVMGLYKPAIGISEICHVIMETVPATVSWIWCPTTSCVRSEAPTILGTRPRKPQELDTVIAV